MTDSESKTEAGMTVKMKEHSTPLGKMTLKKIYELLLIGQRMSNYCYNMKQSVDTPPSMRTYMESLQKEWDTCRHGEVR